MKRFSLIAVLILAGCAARPIHPGAANVFDSNAYDSVLVAHSVIETTKTDLANGAFPASIAGNVKTALNALIASYDAADKLYLVYHSAALAGTATTAQSTDLTNALNDVNAKTSALTSAKAAKPVAELDCPEGFYRIEVVNSDLASSHYACAIKAGVMIGAAQ